MLEFILGFVSGLFFLIMIVPYFYGILIKKRLKGLIDFFKGGLTTESSHVNIEEQ